MNTKHTPTPWKLKADSVNGKQTQIYVDGEKIATTNFGKILDSGSQENQEANAELIVKAVNRDHVFEEMLGACKDALSGAWILATSGNKDAVRIHNKLREAIAKAGGEI